MYLYQDDPPIRRLSLLWFLYITALSLLGRPIANESSHFPDVLLRHPSALLSDSSDSYSYSSVTSSHPSYSSIKTHTKEPRDLIFQSSPSNPPDLLSFRSPIAATLLRLLFQPKHPYSSQWRLCHLTRSCFFTRSPITQKIIQNWRISPYVGRHCWEHDVFREPCWHRSANRWDYRPVFEFHGFWLGLVRSASRDGVANRRHCDDLRVFTSCREGSLPTYCDQHPPLILFGVVAATHRSAVANDRNCLAALGLFRAVRHRWLFFHRRILWLILGIGNTALFRKFAIVQSGFPDCFVTVLRPLVDSPYAIFWDIVVHIALAEHVSMSAFFWKNRTPKKKKSRIIPSAITLERIENRTFIKMERDHMLPSGRHDNLVFCFQEEATATFLTLGNDRRQLHSQHAISHHEKPCGVLEAK
jgi:hypothetical protein